MPLEQWPPIDSHEVLLAALKDDLGYCTCASDDSIPFLRNLLRLVDERTDSVADPARYKNASEGIVALLNDAGSPAMQSWFVYALDNADYIMHGLNLYDLWATYRGRWLLAGLELYAEPPPEDDAA